MRLTYNGIDPAASKDELLASDDVVPADLDALTAFLEDDFNGNRIVIDCTASQDVANKYPEWLSRGVRGDDQQGGRRPRQPVQPGQAGTALEQLPWLYETTAPVGPAATGDAQGHDAVGRRGQAGLRPLLGNDLVHLVAAAGGGAALAGARRRRQGVLRARPARRPQRRRQRAHARRAGARPRPRARGGRRRVRVAAAAGAQRLGA